MAVTDKGNVTVKGSAPKAPHKKMGQTPEATNYGMDPNRKVKGK